MNSVNLSRLLLSNDRNEQLYPFTSSDVEKNIHQDLESYNSNGILYLKNYASESNLKFLIKELDHIQEGGEEDIKNNSNNEIVCFYSKNQSNSESEKMNIVLSQIYKHVKITRMFLREHRL